MSRTDISAHCRPGIGISHFFTFNTLLRFAFLLAIIFCPAVAYCADGPEIGEEIFSASATNAQTGAEKGLSASQLKIIDKLLATALKGKELPATEKANLVRLKEYLGGKKKISESDRRNQLSTDLKELLQKQLAEKKDDRQRLLDMAMFYLFLDEPEKALPYIKKAGPASAHDIYHPLLMSYTQLRLGDYTRADDFILKVESLMAGRKPLKLSTPVFCASISAFRLYTPRADTPINPGEDILLYIEIGGAVFKSGGDGAACNLRFGLTLKDELQNQIWSEGNYGQWVKTYNGPVHDLHVMISYHIPNNLKRGRYSLFVNCTDENANTKGQCDIGFDIGR